MRKSLYPRIVLSVLGSICLAFLFSGFFTINYNSKDSHSSNDSLVASAEKVIPLRIQIPSIEVDASIKSVGLTEQQTMASPDGPSDTAWFKLGASPGEKGSSVIAGHRGWKIGRAVFDDLDKIKVGDNVYVEDEKGDTLTFVVREMRVYDADQIVPEVWNKEDGAYLNLITCSGNWNVLTGTSNQRLVVFTDLVT